MVFIVFQRERGDLQTETLHSSFKPIFQWFVFISAGAVILYGIRQINRRLKSQTIHTTNSDRAPDYFLGSLVDSVAVFLGVALIRLDDCRAARWFLISFSIFGMIFKIFFTDSLFVMLTTSNSNRITSIDQLLRTNIPIYVDFDVGATFFDVGNVSWVLVVPIFNIHATIAIYYTAEQKNFDVMPIFQPYP